MGEKLHHRPLPLIGFLVMAAVLLVFAFVHHLWVGLGLSILLGMGASLIGIPMQTLIQVRTPATMRGKVFGFQNNIVNIALSVPLAIAGILSDFLGLTVVMVGMGGVVAIAGIWAWRNTRAVLEDAI